MELIIKNRIEWMLEHNEVLPKSQFGFRKGKGVHDNLNLLNTEIRCNMSKIENMLALFVIILT